ncbi:MAG: DUF2148 domain-containing protein [Euryarchaeota archaeon]|nr:DUF2148 domain-containing protein [Euryarchaeota archaeon]
MSLKDTIHLVAELMELSARTSPKGLGQDLIEIRVLTDEERVAIGNDMLALAAETRRQGFERDGRNVLDASGLVLIGLMPHKGAGLNCGACGFKDCASFNAASNIGEFEGPNCSIRMLDMGIALGSAVKTASDLNVDNRIMYRIGVSARRTGLMRSNIVHGIPLSATGKNIFFDRVPKQ